MVSAQTAHRHAANPAPSSLHAHPVHDPCSREGDAGEYAGGSKSVSAVAKTFLRKATRMVLLLAEGNAISMACVMVRGKEKSSVANDGQNLSTRLRSSLFELRRTSRSLARQGMTGGLFTAADFERLQFHQHGGRRAGYSAASGLASPST